MKTQKWLSRSRWVLSNREGVEEPSMFTEPVEISSCGGWILSLRVSLEPDQTVQLLFLVKRRVR